MKFRMEDLGDSKTYLEVEKMEGWLQISAGYPDSSRRTSITGLNHREALALAGVLQAFAATLE